MTREQSAILRFALICAAWAVGRTLTWGLDLESLGAIVPAAFALGVLVVTEDLGRPRSRGGDLKYWRGKQINDDERRGRWN